MTYSAAVTSSAGTPTGSVVFSAGTTPLCTAPLVAGVGSCTASDAPLGADGVTGEYSGDLNFAASSGTTVLDVGSPSPQVTTPVPSGAYDLVGSDGGVFVFGGSGGYFGSLPGLGVHVNDIVGIVPTATDAGYFLVGSRRRGVRLRRRPLRELAPRPGRPRATTSSGSCHAPTKGYFLVGSDGGVFAFGDAFRELAPRARRPRERHRGIAVTLMTWATGWSAVDRLGVRPGRRPVPRRPRREALPRSTGSPPPATRGATGWSSERCRVYPFGRRQVLNGSLPAAGVNVSNINAVVPTPDEGYWLVGSDGGVFAFGDASEVGSLPELGVKSQRHRRRRPHMTSRLTGGPEQPPPWAGALGGRMPRVADRRWRVALFSDIADVVTMLSTSLRRMGDEPVAAFSSRGWASIPRSTDRERRYLPLGFGSLLVADRDRLAPVLRTVRPDAVICWAFAWRIPPEVLEIPRFGTVNYHPSLLPRHRGPNPLAWTIRTGDSHFGVTWHRLVQEFRCRPNHGATGHAGPRRGHPGRRGFSRLNVYGPSMLPEVIWHAGLRAFRGSPG